MGSLLQNVKNNLIIDDHIYTEMKKNAFTNLYCENICCEMRV